MEGEYDGRERCTLMRSLRVDLFLMTVGGQWLAWLTWLDHEIGQRQTGHIVHCMMNDE